MKMNEAGTMRPLHLVYITPRYPGGHSWEALWAGYLNANYAPRRGDVADYFNLFYDDRSRVIYTAAEADIVAISATSPQYRDALNLKMEITNAWLSDLRFDKPQKRPVFVIGGPHPSALPHDVEADGWDYVIRGEGEWHWDKITYKHRHGGSYKIAENPVVPINRIDFPDRILIKQERHIQQAVEDEGRRVLAMLSSRGCAFRCDFCISHAIWGRKPRFRTPLNILKEMEQVIDDWHPDFIKFADDTFTLKKDRLLKLFELMKERGLNIKWGCNVHIKTVTPDMLYDMAKAGCTEIWVGVESGSQKVREAMGKGKHTNEQLVNLFRIARDAGIKTRAYWMIGHPTESMADLLETKALAEKVGADINSVTVLCPFPGSAHYNPKTMKDWHWSDCDEYGNPYWRTEHFSNYQLREHQKDLVKHFKDIGSLAYKHKVCGYGI